MARLARAELFAPDEVAIVHVMNRVVRRCFLLGVDPLTGNDYDHRRQWFENELERLAGAMGIDLLGFAVLSNHFHLILRSRPDVVATWDDTEVARRWLLVCPRRKQDDGSAAEPGECELNSIRHDPDRLLEIRRRLSRCSHKGFLAMSVEEHLALLDWTARQTAPGKRGSTPAAAPPILARLRLSPTTWCELVRDFGRLFSTVAGHPRTVEGTRSHRCRRRFHMARRVRELFFVEK